MNKTRRIALLLAVLFCLSAVTFVAVAKYIKDVPFEGQVTFTAALAESLTLTESEANRNPDGTYSLDTSKPVENNTYTLMPGVDVPKDPKITIKGKTAIPAYLYVEVNSTLPEGVTYALTGKWTLLEGHSNVYYYNDVLPTGDSTVQILNNNTVYVSDKIPRDTVATLTFRAYLFQNIGTPKESFKPSP